MKLRELKEALDWSPLVGHYGQSFLGGKPEGSDREARVAKNIFARNFMQKAITGLDSAINSGLVNPNVASAVVQPQTTQTPPTQTTQAQTPAQVRQQKQAIAAKAAQAGMTPKATNQVSAPLTPAQIRQQKQAAAAQAAQAGMTDKPAAKPKVWRSNRADGKSFAMENKAFAKLNNIFESIVNVNEATGQSISQYIQGLFMQYMKGVTINDPNTIQQIKTLADEVQATYSKDKGKNALTKLADLGWAASHSPEANQQAAGQQSATAGQPQAAADQKSTIGVKQINKLIPTLRKRDLLSVKKNVDNTLAGRGATVPSAAPAATPSPAAPAAAPAANNIVKMPKGKVRAAKEGGVTPEEQAKFDEKVRQAMASQK